MIEIIDPTRCYIKYNNMQMVEEYKKTLVNKIQFLSEIMNVSLKGRNDTEEPILADEERLKQQKELLVKRIGQYEKFLKKRTRT